VNVLRDLFGRKAADRSVTVDSVAILIVILGTIINPFVYAFVNDDIRKAYRFALDRVMPQRPRVLLSSLVRRSKRKTMPSIQVEPCNAGVDGDEDKRVDTTEQTELPTTVTADEARHRSVTGQLAAPVHSVVDDSRDRGVSISVSVLSEDLADYDADRRILQMESKSRLGSDVVRSDRESSYVELDNDPNSPQRPAACGGQ
jgi:hypothetical protein